MTDDSHNLQRYQRQIRFAPLGEAGQRRLTDASVLVCGAGALGCVVADSLVRAGVGHVRLVDRDFVELNNLHRQLLFDESDAQAQLPKAVAAAARLERINSSVTIEPVVADVNSTNIVQLADGVDLLVDGTDNFETRYLLNDYAVAHSVPWIFAGCVGTEGQTLAVLPGETPCLSCLMPEIPAAAELPTCESAGVLGPIVSIMASLEAIEAIKILSGNRQQVNRSMVVVDLWHNQLRTVNVAAARAENCITCRERQFPWLRGERGTTATRLCGRNSVQLAATGPPGSVNLELLANRLKSVGRVTTNRFLLRLAVEEFLITLFPDGRAIVTGTDDPAIARTVHAKYIGT